MAWFSLHQDTDTVRKATFKTITNTQCGASSECAEDRTRVIMLLESPLRYTLKNEISIGCISLLSKLSYVRNAAVLNSF